MMERWLLVCAAVEQVASSFATARYFESCIMQRRRLVQVCAHFAVGQDLARL